MGFWGVILKPWRACIAIEDWLSSSNSTKAIPGFASIMRTSLNPGYCLNSTSSIILVVSYGRFWMNSILLGGSTTSWAPGCFPGRDGTWTFFLKWSMMSTTKYHLCASILQLNWHANLHHLQKKKKESYIYMLIYLWKHQCLNFETPETLYHCLGAHMIRSHTRFQFKD